MNQIINIYDAYNLRVRLSVGLILITPIIISIYLLVPNASNISFTVIVLILCFGLCNLMMSLSRYLGRKVTSKCFPELMPAQQMLMPTDDTLDSITKQRYHKFFLSKIENLSFSKDSDNAINSCKSSINWLISQTRDSEKFPLIKEETINFGFSKNLYGLKPLGICVSSSLAFFEIGLIVAKYHFQFAYVDYSNLIASAIISFASAMVWVFLITETWVKDSAHRYAKVLLSACDSEFLNISPN